jgi:hypothetical protein
MTGYRLSAIDRRDLSLDAPTAPGDECVPNSRGDRVTARDIVDEEAMWITYDPRASGL